MLRTRRFPWAKSTNEVQPRKTGNPSMVFIFYTSPKWYFTHLQNYASPKWLNDISRISKMISARSPCGFWGVNATRRGWRDVFCRKPDHSSMGCHTPLFSDLCKWTLLVGNYKLSLDLMSTNHDWSDMVGNIFFVTQALQWGTDLSWVQPRACCFGVQ